MPNVMEKHFIFVVINAGRNSCQNQRELSAKAGLEDGVKKGRYLHRQTLLIEIGL